MHLSPSHARSLIAFMGTAHVYVHARMSQSARPHCDRGHGGARVGFTAAADPGASVWQPCAAWGRRPAAMTVPSTHPWLHRCLCSNSSGGRGSGNESGWTSNDVDNSDPRLVRPPTHVCVPSQRTRAAHHCVMSGSLAHKKLDTKVFMTMSLHAHMPGDRWSFDACLLSPFYFTKGAGIHMQRMRDAPTQDVFKACVQPWCRHYHLRRLQEQASHCRQPRVVR